MKPGSSAEALALLKGLRAPPRLLRHVELVGEAADILLERFSSLGVAVDEEYVRVGVVLHDAGKVLHENELAASGAQHEPAGEQLLLTHGVSPEIARVCLSHARWRYMSVSLKELLIALADKLWKGVRSPDLEELVVSRVAAALSRDRWDLFVALDGAFEEIALGGDERLVRSQIY